MKRTVITVDGNGELSIPSNLKDLWMSEGELVDMLHVTAPKLHAVIRSIYKDGLLTGVGSPTETGNFQWHLANVVWLSDDCCPLLPYKLIRGSSVSCHHLQEIVRGKREK